jgi:hypothetical protein
MKRFIAAIVLACVSTGCASTRSIAKSYVGSQVSEMVLQNGPPDAIVPVGNGKYIYTWERRGGILIPGAGAIRFIVDENGKILGFAKDFGL